MTFLQALILGIVQGITEFFPVSSSAHLRIAKKLLGIADGEHLLYFDLLCHFGTLLALIIYLRKEILVTIKSKQQIALFFLGIIPLIPGYFLLKPLRIALSDPSYLGFFLLLTSALLFAAGSIRNKPNQEHSWSKAIWIGLAQTCALIPGISRSCATITMARFHGIPFLKGAQFSFLLAIPTILGGEFLETIKLASSHQEFTTNIPLTSYIASFCSSFGCGLFSVRSVFWIYKREVIYPFAWYCLGVGFIALALFHG